MFMPVFNVTLFHTLYWERKNSVSYFRRSYVQEETNVYHVDSFLNVLDLQQRLYHCSSKSQ
jgi:hypothetical protein